MTTVDGRLRASGLKATATRRAVFLALEEYPHSGVGAVLTRVRDSLPEASAQAVYGVLSAFTDAGLVRRIEPEGHPRRFELRVGDNHHHVVCRSCGAVADVECVVGEAPCLHPSMASGFAIDTADVTFWGTCPDCLVLAVH
ncbi:Fur family transcriptional regulator [Rathayibacter iranicus]|uniref:Transcriptional repressor n=2 Tax=Rathayibacter iranicus TaxID=59737 RepID=A0AAD1AGS3_9MICO|nr:Fur family transcriptional regulator [Rathayibacter iranicus]AZZ56765.1 transcriptional repressor [Rathayibacter iranicus]MWV31188.1 transcriptional repressor [Rathayibacter iranicus NCPPB 2253 = VKM Ac-1602]PPI43105.1 transcriptional repressor [Rathayibacter iranicus]PPI58356.1 transcriptional repressor [Rathayibacter iranicus]PPI69253.1 transcriptional repressor [Rathayibacter iranicus]